MLVDGQSVEGVLHMLRDLYVDERVWLGIFAVPRYWDSQSTYSICSTKAELNIDEIQLTDCVPASYCSNRHTPSRQSVLLVVSYTLFLSFINSLLSELLDTLDP
jgi:hypothetical protein